MSGKKPPVKSKKKIRKFRPVRLVFLTIFTAFAAAFCSMAVYAYVMVSGHNYLSDNIDRLVMDEASIIYDSSGREVTRLFIENREMVSSEEIPPLLRAAFIATEDRRFSEHTGIDFWAIGRALYKDLIHRRAVEGGSTITQQLAKNLFLSADKTLVRKANEATIALALENNFTKDEILVMYLNRIFFGSTAHGVKAAAKVYFNKELNELTIGEMAMLAGLPKAPSQYSPLNNPELAVQRRNLVLRLMFEQNYITYEQRMEAEREEYVRPPRQIHVSQYLTYADYVIQETVRLTGLTEQQLHRGGFSIYTTMDVKAQKAMEEAFANEEFFQKDGPQQKMEAGMVILDHHTGGIVAMVGGREYVARGFNRALAKRQPGSAFKPLAVYAPALESGQWHPYSLLKDERLSYGNYSPRNYDNRYRGEVDMFEAVKLSINAPAVWLLNEIGIAGGMQFVRNLGIELDDGDRNLSIALGGLTKGASPLEMAQAYGAIANNGQMNKTHAILKVVDSQGQAIYTFQPETKTVMSPRTAYYMTLMLQTVVEPGGTGARGRMNRPVAGKTGSTQSALPGLDRYDRDIWFVGYTAEWTSAVWMGFDRTDADHVVTIGSGSSAALFRDVMTKALEGRPAVAFRKPDGVPELAGPPAAAGDVAASYSHAQRSVMVSWSPAPGSVTYMLYRQESGQEEPELLLSTPFNEVRDITVEAGRSYSYYIIVRDNETGLLSRRSNEAEVYVPEEESGSLLPPLEDLIDVPEQEEEQPEQPQDGGAEQPPAGELDSSGLQRFLPGGQPDRPRIPLFR